ncbi:hypothetical protein [Pandoraea oxalativorans]|uniref:Uncharacterized protein n=1 Tax=Pandoraea oxalativorans TaxID=573737 RepID=A0A0G3IG77_9BURK|nr:hypothetical protein [Pandoraea oxalativorans]AKK24841.1 hypothetical protein MB84_29140 [Pandoraea oxalativorans]
MTFTSTGSGASEGQLEAELTRATVQVARPDQRPLLVETTQRHLDVPAAAPDGWERLKHALATLFGARGVKFVVGGVNELTDPAELARPAGIDLHLDDPMAWFVRAEQAYGPRRHRVARYRTDNDAHRVYRDRAPVDAETQQKVTDLCAHAMVQNRANNLRAGRLLHIGTPSFTCWVPPLDERTSPRATPLPPSTYGAGNAHVRELARLAAQDNARLQAEIRAMLTGALFPAPRTPPLVIQVDGEDVINASLASLGEAGAALSNLAQLALPEAADLAPLLTKWARKHHLSAPPPNQMTFEVAKEAVFGRAIELIQRSLPADAALRRHVLATLARGEAAMHRVSRNNGLPVFENPRLEQRKIILFARRTFWHRLAHRVDIAFHSWQHTLHDDARVRFGAEARNVFPAHSLSTAMLLSKASYSVTNRNTELRSVRYEAQLALPPLCLRPHSFSNRTARKTYRITTDRRLRLSGARRVCGNSFMWMPARPGRDAKSRHARR